MATCDGINIDILSDEIFNKLCVTCKRKDKNSEANKYCIDCQDYYCLKCVKVHEDVPLLSDHEIFDIDDFQSCKISTASMPTAPTEQCDRHKHKHVDMYCLNHDDVGCSTCMTVDHGSCHSRFYISEYIHRDEYIQKDVTTDAIEQELKLIAKSLTENRIFFERNKEQLLKEKSRLLDDIKMFRDEVNAKLDYLEKTTLYEVNVKFDTLIDSSDRQLILLKSSKKSELLALKRLESSNVSMSQKFVNYKRGKQIFNSVSKELEDIGTHKQNITFGFKPCKEIKALLDTKTCLGKVRKIFRQDLLLNITSQEL